MITMHGRRPLARLLPFHRANSDENGVVPARAVALRGERGSLSPLFCRFPRPNAAVIAPAIYSTPRSSKQKSRGEQTNRISYERSTLKDSAHVRLAGSRCTSLEGMAWAGLALSCTAITYPFPAAGNAQPDETGRRKAACRSPKNRLQR